MDHKNYYLKFVTDIKAMSHTHVFYHVGGNFIVEVSKTDHDLKSKNDLMNVWKRMGYIKKALPSHVVIHTYFTDKNGNCWGYYNITTKRSDDGKQNVINFDYLLEYTPENVEYLVNECIRLREMDIKR